MQINEILSEQNTELLKQAGVAGPSIPAYHGTVKAHRGELFFDTKKIHPKDQFMGEGFYRNIKAQVTANPDLQRWSRNVEFIFSVAADELATYIDVNSPSSSIVQERPEFTNINNGIGIFSSRYIKTRKMLLTTESDKELQSGIHTAGLGFIKKPLTQ